MLQNNHISADINQCAIRRNNIAGIKGNAIDPSNRILKRLHFCRNEKILGIIERIAGRIRLGSGFVLQKANIPNNAIDYIRQRYPQLCFNLGTKFGKRNP